MNAYGPRIARARKLAGLTQDGLAELLEVDAKTIKRHEHPQTGKPKKIDRLAISWVLGISPDYIEGEIADPLAASDDVAQQLDRLNAAVSQLAADVARQAQALQEHRDTDHRGESHSGGGR